MRGSSPRMTLGVVVRSQGRVTFTSPRRGYGIPESDSRMFADVIQGFRPGFGGGRSDVIWRYSGSGACGLAD
jgi:hypothetical protein